jgi:hypothetical protein
MKIEFDIFNRESFRTLTFSLKFQKKAQVSSITKFVFYYVNQKNKDICPRWTYFNVATYQKG